MKKRLLIHPYKPIEVGTGTPHCQEMSIAACMLWATIAPATLYQESEFAIQCYLSQFDEVVVNVFAPRAEQSNVLKALLALPSCTLLVNDPAYAYDCGLNVSKVLFCGNPALFNEASVIAAIRAGKKQIKPCETLHFPLFARMWDEIEGLPQAAGAPAGIAYNGFYRSYYRHQQALILANSAIWAHFAGYSIQANENTCSYKRLDVNEGYKLSAICGAVAILGDEEYYAFGHFSHRLHQAYALNCIAFVHASLADYYLPKELASKLSFSCTEELEEKWAYAKDNYIVLRAMQRQWQKQCIDESLALCKDL